MIRLGAVAQGRDNNFHLLRLIAASAVLYSHSYPLVTGDQASEPLRALLGVTPGSIAVDMFFFISGLLVTASLERGKSYGYFVRARILRIWPALAVAIALTVLVLGPVVSDESGSDYFRAHGTWKYVAANLLVVHGMAYDLPGVFVANPWHGAVNGSLWTLPSEVRCYIALLAFWFTARLASGKRFAVVVGIAWMAFAVWHLASLNHVSSLLEAPVRLQLMFASGVAAYVLRERIFLGWVPLATALLVPAVAAGLDRTAFSAAYSLALPIVTLCLAYVPRGPLLAFNRLGDYSYGTYIYAFPVQQTLMHAFPAMSPLGLFAASLAITLPLAVLSWHVVEQPALAFVKRRPASRPDARSATTAN